ncbi:MAG: LLM class flavin-dependent oxidoreductase [Alphaproteobacteria bacterium]|nr:LLM class flavin-dependent oxidoreductase [Alphaproteobacteria bacterium]
MDVGVQMVFSSHGWPGIRDSQVVDEELRLARLADELGFDVIWSVEHHFFDYSFCPDNAQLLSYLAAVIKNADVGTAAVILPWNEPLRVAEKIALLDHLAGGRLRFGIGRGLSRREYAAFRGIAMDESRERFDEAADMIMAALRTGFIEGNGKFYPQPRIEIRPRPERSFDDRLYAVASSDDSVESAARLKATMVMFADRSWEHRMPSVEKHRSRFRELHGVAAPPPMTCDFCVCAPTQDEAKDLAERHMALYLDSVLEHYEVMGSHFASTKGYGAYAQAAEVLRRIGESGFLKGFMQATAWGTPDGVLKTMEARRNLLGPFELATSFRFGGVPYAKAEQSLRLFAREVLPVLKGWDKAIERQRAVA